MREGVYEMAEDEGWVKAEWFKLHLRPRSQSSPNISAEIPPLPPGKTVVQVFADFLRYLRDCAAFYIQDTHANGAELWESVKGDVDYVLSHPNGWEGAQQEMMRQAAALAGLIPNTPEGHGRVSFVTEGEASLHFSIQNGLPAGAMTVSTHPERAWSDADQRGLCRTVMALSSSMLEAVLLTLVPTAVATVKQGPLKRSHLRNATSMVPSSSASMLDCSSKVRSTLA
jgi:hypothetical protein